MTNQFPNDLVLRVWFPDETGSRQQYTTREPFVFRSAKFGDITVPAGFSTDFASIPRFAWRYIDPEDPAILMPSVVHDYLYTSKILERDQADAVLREAMEACGARWDQCFAVYHAVRLFGGSHYK